MTDLVARAAKPAEPRALNFAPERHAPFAPERGTSSFQERL
jgi:hypothetical protein